MNFRDDLIPDMKENQEHIVGYSFKSLYNTIGQCNDVERIKIDSTAHDYGINGAIIGMDIYLGRNISSAYRLWMLFTDINTCYIYKIYEFSTDIHIIKVYPKMLESGLKFIETTDKEIREMFGVN